MFHGLYQRYQAEEVAQEASGVSTLWPPIYRFALPKEGPSHFELNISVENQPARTFTMDQIKALPTSTEVRLIASKFGWAFRCQWSCLTFQTLFSLFSTPAMYQYVKLNSLNGKEMIIKREELLQWRVVYAAEDKPLSVLHGGPLWVHHFDNMVEYAFPHLKSMMLLQSDKATPSFPGEPLGYQLSNEQAHIPAGEYFSIHEERVVHLGHLGRKV